MNKMKQHLYYTLPLVIWAGVIFCMSHMNASSSSDLSGSVGLLIGELFVPGFENLTEANQLLYAENIQFIVRKSAHICEYMILGILISRVVCNIKVVYNVKILCNEKVTGSIRTKLYMMYEKYWYVTAFALGVLYAITDEIHQLFIPGRSGQVTDVLVDSVGVAIGILMYRSWLKMRMKSLRIKP